MVDSTQILIDRLVAAGRTVKQAGQDRWVAQCPAHDDGRPSLSVMRSRGRALTFCFAGCTAGAIAGAVGLTLTDLFDDPKGIDYEYKHQGRVVRTVHRSPAKQFAQRVIDKSVLPLYQPPGVDVASAVAKGRDVWIPEGEQDAEVLARLGLVAVASAMGAASWRQTDYTVLRGASDLYIVADRDEPGMVRASGLREHLAELTSGVVRVMQSAVGKDPADHVTAGYGVADFQEVAAPEPVDHEFEEAVHREREFLRVKAEARRRDAEDAAKVTSDTLAPKDLGEILALDVKYDWLIPGLLERQDRLVLTGEEGLGKSYLLRQIALTFAGGVHPFRKGEAIDPGRVLVVDAENTERQWSRNAQYLTWLLEQGGGARNLRKAVKVAAGVRLDLNLRADVNQVHRLIDQHKPDVLYIGPLYKLVAKAINSDDDAAPLILALDGFRERGVTLLMEAHAGHAKALGGERDLRPRGSSALLGWPEFGFGLAGVEGDDSMVLVKRWRGERDKRDWPHRLRRGVKGELTWEESW